MSNRADRPLRSLSAFRDFVARYEAMGITDIVLHDPRPDDPYWNDDPEVLAAVADAFCPATDRPA